MMGDGQGNTAVTFTHVQEQVDSKPFFLFTWEYGNAQIYIPASPKAGSFFKIRRGKN